MKLSKDKKVGLLAADEVNRIPAMESLVEMLETRAKESIEQDWCQKLLTTEGVESGSAQEHLLSLLRDLRPGTDLLRLAQRWAEKQERAQLHDERSPAEKRAWVSITLLPLVGLALSIAFSNWWLMGAAVWLIAALLWVPEFIRGRWHRKMSLENAPAELSQAATDLNRRLRSLAEKSVRLATRPQFESPIQDVVTVGEGPKLSSRVLESQRVATKSRSVIELHMLRAGGATVGVTGERGTGKSEVLRSFCDNAASRASVDKGGTIGVFVAVPAAFNGLDFLKVLTRRLVEAVPGYATPQAVRARRRRWLGALTMLSGAALATVALLGLLAWTDGPRLTARYLWAVVLVTGVALYVFGIRVGITSSRFLGAASLNTSSESDSLLLSARRAVAQDAAELMTRLRYAETVTSASEGSVSWGKLGLKRSRQQSLTELPVTEADLIAEFSSLVERLERVGYRVTVGIDEMDKLEPGPATEQFLNSVKQLFSTPSCSFLVSVSSSAWSQFLQRGIEVRDALDSSLDSIETIEAFEFLETRSLIRHRGEEMSDSQILFCHVLSGGLPREVLRAARTLARLNHEQGGAQALSTLANRVVDREFQQLVEVMRQQASAWESPRRELMVTDLTALGKAWSQEATRENRIRAYLERVFGEAADSDRCASEELGPLPRLCLLGWLFILAGQTFSSEYSTNSADWSRHLLLVGEKLTKARQLIESNPAAAYANLVEVSPQVGILGATQTHASHTA